MSNANEITQLLVRWSDGDAQALEQLVPLVYEQCRAIAARQLSHERAQHTLQPTALVHELYLRLVDQNQVNWQNRAQFFAVSAQMMRRILVDYARARRTRKRGGSAVFVSLSAAATTADEEEQVANVLEVDEALHRLARIDPEQGRIIELRYFAGLTVEETALVVQRSARTVKREWRLAKAWLHRELASQPPLESKDRA